MSREVRRSDYFLADFDRRFRWFDRKAGWEIAPRFRDPELRGVRWIAVKKPFQNHLIFYRIQSDGIEAWRLLHGAQDLPQRLWEPPGYQDDDSE